MVYPHKTLDRFQPNLLSDLLIQLRHAEAFNFSSVARGPREKSKSIESVGIYDVVTSTVRSV